MAGDQWYIRTNGKKHGPFNYEQVEKLARTNRQGDVWTPSMTDWQPVKTFFSTDADTTVQKVRQSAKVTEQSKKIVQPNSSDKKLSNVVQQLRKVNQTEHSLIDAKLQHKQAKDMENMLKQFIDFDQKQFLAKKAFMLKLILQQKQQIESIKTAFAQNKTELEGRIAQLEKQLAAQAQTPVKAAAKPMAEKPGKTISKPVLKKSSVAVADPVLAPDVDEDDQNFLNVEKNRISADFHQPLTTDRVESAIEESDELENEAKLATEHRPITMEDVENIELLFPEELLDDEEEKTAVNESSKRMGRRRRRRRH